MKRIAVLGAGHGGCAVAGDLTLRGYEVRLYSRSRSTLDAIRNRGGIEVVGAREGFARVALVTEDLGQAVRGADMLVLVVPSTAHEYYAQALAPLLSGDLPIFINPGHTGGGLHFVHALRRAGYAGPVRTGETVTLTYICRLEGPARVAIYTPTKHLRFATLPGNALEELRPLIQELYPNVAPASSVLETAFLNINAILHPPGMLLNTGWLEQTGGDFLFYHEAITPAVGRVIAELDQERLAVAKALGIPSIGVLQHFFEAGLTTREAMESGDVSRACRESAPNRTIKTPGSLRHRYVDEDVGFGLVPMRELGRLGGVETPIMDALIDLASAATGTDFRQEGLTLEKMGLAGRRPADLPRFLQEGL